MILPTKHIRSDRALIGVGAEVLSTLRRPMTMSKLWDEIRLRRSVDTASPVIDYRWFVLAPRPPIHDRSRGVRTWPDQQVQVMIRQLSSDLESFKSLTFEPGLNIILADKSEGASDFQSRNGAGKTSLVELVHFLFGADTRSDSIFRSEALKDRTFSASVDIGSKTYSVSRSGKKPSRVYVDGEIEDWPVDSHQEFFSAPHELPNEQWKNALGALWFRLPANGGGEPFQPSFRSLFSFVARRQEGGGFQQPMQHSTMQQPWDQQATICYLIGLDSTIPGRFQKLRGREKVAKELRKALRRFRRTRSLLWQGGGVTNAAYPRGGPR